MIHFISFDQNTNDDDDDDTEITTINERRKKTNKQTKKFIFQKAYCLCTSCFIEIPFFLLLLLCLLFLSK